jgi:hypothetical protein
MQKFGLHANIQSCTNLLADESYCVAAVGDINTYSGRPGHTSAALSQVTGTQKYSSLPTATYVPIPFNTTKRLLADGTRSDCDMYFDGGRYQSLQSFGLTTYNSICEFVADMFGVSIMDLEFWNPGNWQPQRLQTTLIDETPAIGNSSSSNCTFQAGVSYCGDYAGTSQPVQVDPIVELPIRVCIPKYHSLRRTEADYSKGRSRQNMHTIRRRRQRRHLCIYSRGQPAHDNAILRL